jgi:hypothetical protein
MNYNYSNGRGNSSTRETGTSGDANSRDARTDGNTISIGGSLREIPFSHGAFLLYNGAQRLYDMNGIFEMQGGKNRILPK